MILVNGSLKKSACVDCIGRGWFLRKKKRIFLVSLHYCKDEKIDVLLLCHSLVEHLLYLVLLRLLIGCHQSLSSHLVLCSFRGLLLPGRWSIAWMRADCLDEDPLPGRRPTGICTDMRWSNPILTPVIEINSL